MGQTRRLLACRNRHIDTSRVIFASLAFFICLCSTAVNGLVLRDTLVWNKPKDEWACELECEIELRIVLEESGMRRQ